MSPQQHPQSREAVMTELGWKINNLDSKIRINEQNVLNERKQVQLLNKNFLDFKKEMRDKVDLLLQENRKVQETMTKLQGLLSTMESKMKKGYARKEDVSELKKHEESVNVFKPEMSKAEANRVLDEILKKGTEAKA